jgi:hypothetical protein
MHRPTMKWLVIVSLAAATLTSAACPSEQQAPSFETQGSNN